MRVECPVGSCIGGAMGIARWRYVQWLAHVQAYRIVEKDSAPVDDLLTKC
jgi:hypothetical protein